MGIRSSRLRAAVMLLWICVAGCGDDPVGPPASVAGAWRLVSVNGVLPATPPGTTGVLMVGGELMLNSDSTFTSSIHYDTRQGPTTQTEAGTYRHRGEVIDFFDDNRLYARAAVTRDRIILPSRDREFVYRRKE